METSAPPQPAIDLSAPLYYQLVHTLTALLPPPPDDTPEALLSRNQAAIAKVAALLPVNANEADLAAQCIAARAQAEEMLRLLRQHAGDIGLVLRLNAQYGSMVRTSLSVHGRLMRVQALRQKREATEAAANQDAWALHVAERSMLGVVDADAGPLAAAWPQVASVAPPVEAATHKVAPVEAPVATPVEAPAAGVDQRVADAVSETGTDSHDAALETWLSEQPWVLRSIGSGKAGLREVVRVATADLRLASREPPANGRESLGRADSNRHIDGEIASA